MATGLDGLNHVRLLAGLLGMTLSGCVGGLPLCPDALYELRTDAPEVRLPRDESPHCFGGFEWWYYSGRLLTEDSRAFGVEAVVFHVPRFPMTPLAEAWVAHYAVLDETTGEFAYDQVRRFRPHAGSHTPEGGFDLKTPLVHMRGGQGQDEMHAAFSDGRFALDLTLTDLRGVVLHGDDGYIPYGEDGMSFYYSRPRMQATGTLDIDGQPEAVNGELWFDRQWGLDLTNPLERWDWFSLRLSDGTCIMLFVFPADARPVATGTYIPPSGEPRALTGQDFLITPTATWTSPSTGIVYDVAWQIEILPEDLSLEVAAVAENQELDTRATAFNIYWEGLCTISGRRHDEQVTGHAYVELANAGL